jgi:uncharacterized protein (TIRG00374 family)
VRLPSPRVIFATNLGVAIAALAWVLWRSGRPAFDVLAAHPSWSMLSAVLVMVAVLLAGFAVRWRIVLGGLGVPPRFAVLGMYRLAAQSISMLVPSAKLGGEPVRAYLLAHDGVQVPGAMASVAVDRVLDMGASTAFTVLFALILLRHGVPALEGTLAGVACGALALLAGVWITVRRLHGGRGVVTSLVRSAGFDRLQAIERRMGALAAAEDSATRLVEQPARMALAFGCGLAINLLVLLEYRLLLGAFALPVDLVAIVAAIFATGAAHSMPVPAGVGVLEGSQMALFTALGHPPEVGLAVGLAVRLRELVWVLPGLLYLVWRGLGGVLLRESTA